MATNQKTLKVVYPGTFDPMTRGHEDIARRAAGLFSEVVVAVAQSPGKEPFFNVAERVEMAAAVLADCPNITVIGFSGLLMQFVQAQGAHVVIRGLRAVSDFEYEFQLAGMNRKLFPEVETVFLTPDEQYLFISASLVREVALLGGDVPLHLAADHQGPDLDLGLHLPRLADDERFLADDLAFQLTVNANGAGEAQHPLELGSFPEEGADLPEIGSDPFLIPLRHRDLRGMRVP